MMTKLFLLGKPVIKALRGGFPRRLGRILFVAINIGFLQSCDHDAFDGIIYKPNGEIAKPEELSAGISTIFSTVSGAYDTNADWVTGELLTRFNRGDGLYDNSRGVGTGSGNGLGPIFGGYSCGACHRNTGRLLHG